MELAQSSAEKKKPLWQTGPVIILSGTIFLMVVLGAIFADFVAPYDPNSINLSVALSGPSLSHILGTDFLGRDILSRIIYGARISLIVGIASVLLAAAIGVSLGLISAYYKG